MKRVMTWLIGAGLALSLAGGAGAQGQARLNGSDAEEFLSAIRKQDGAAVEEIFTRKGASVINYRGFDGETPLTLAMTKRSGEYVGYLVANGAEPDYPDKHGDTGLIIAARTG